MIELVRYLCAVVALGVVVGAPFTLVMPVLRNFNDGERLFNTDIGWGLRGNMGIIFCCVPISSFYLDFELVNYFVTTGVTVSIVYFFGFGRSSFLSIKAWARAFISCSFFYISIYHFSSSLRRFSDC